MTRDILTPTSPEFRQVGNIKAEARQLLAKWVASAEIIAAQINFGNPILIIRLGFEALLVELESLWTSFLPASSMLNPLGGSGSRHGPAASQRAGHQVIMGHQIRIEGLGLRLR